MMQLGAHHDILSYVMNPMFSGRYVIYARLREKRTNPLRNSP